MHPHNDRAIWFVIFIIFVFISLSFVFTQYEILQIKNNSANNMVQPIAIATISPTLTPTAFPTSTPSSVASPTPIIIYNSSGVVKVNNQITYIPLTGGNTQHTDWVNVSGSQFTLNINDYGNKAYASWDANLRVDNANGTTFARLFDITHGIAVNGSEINISNTSSSTDVLSGALSFWAGNNNYVVQLKSLNSSNAFMDSGRIKITY